MTRMHDMGGRFGDGPIEPEAQGIPQLNDWQARVLALTLACGALGQWNIDMSRHAREKLSPADYVRFSYFEIWIAALADLLVQTGVLSMQDLKSDGTTAPHPLADRVLRAPTVAATLAKGGPADRMGDQTPIYRIGQAVRACHPAQNRYVDGGHTRLPAYAAGALGYIERVHGHHVLPDCNAHGLGEAPEPLYAVRFAATGLWAHPEHPEDMVILDLWQSYLDPA